MLQNSAFQRAVLWDMDGTLVDSATYHYQAWRDTLAGEGIALPYERFAATFGQRNDTILQGLFGPQIAQAEIARISDAKEALYRELVRREGVTLLPGVAIWLERLRATGWQQAIASAAPCANIEAILAALSIGAYFAALVAAEDVSRGKPDPQVFLCAAEKLGIAPARCVVVEDAPAGVEAGRRAGMHTIGVHADLAADLAVASLLDLPSDAFAELITT